MTKYYFPNPACLLLLAGLFINSCKGQVNTSLAKHNANTSKPIPEITGTPPPFVPITGLPYDTCLVSQYIRSIFQDSKGNFWFGPLGHSVVRYDGKTLKYYSEPEFFQGNDHTQHENGISVQAIAEDQNGNIWFGTNDGAIKYDGLTFRRYTEKNGLSNINVGRKSILADKSGTVWVGTAGGVFRYHPSADSTGGKCFSLFDVIPAIPIQDMMEDRSGNIWFAAQDNGVFQLRGNSITHLTGNEGLGNNYAGGMAQDKNGNYWFTMKGGICKYQPGENSFTEFTPQDGLGGSEVWGIYIETSGIIWITARGSTTRYDPSIDISDPKAFTVFTPEDGINCCVQSMYQDRSGNMWWGAGQGLYRFDGQRFYQVKRNGPW